jgi:hypothetical protein
MRKWLDTSSHYFEGLLTSFSVKYPIYDLYGAEQLIVEITVNIDWVRRPSMPLQPKPIP